jgi:CRISPR system Cascade subunit CasE
MTLYLSRLRLSRRPSARALDAILNPTEPGLRLDAHHRLLWAAFADSPDRRRDFLWREEAAGDFLTLSARPPAPSDLFEAAEVKDFAPRLGPGDRLFFALRANATRDRKGVGRVDVVMDALHALPKDARASERMAFAQQEGATWLARQGEAAGFRLIGAEVGDYSVAALPGHRGGRRGQPQFGVLDMTGTLDVTDPTVFLARLAQGFGRAKAFGCGLMLIRRAG